MEDVEKLERIQKQVTKMLKIEVSTRKVERVMCSLEKSRLRSGEESS